MSSEGGNMKSPAPPSPPASPGSPLSDRGERAEVGPRPQEASEDTKPLAPALDPANFRGLISLKQMQERSFSLVNQALLRQKLVEEQIKIERDAEIENNNDKESVNNNSGAEDAGPEGISFVEARRRFLACDSGQAGPGGRLAFSVENILAPGKFGREQDEDQEQFGEFCFISCRSTYLQYIWARLKFCYYHQGRIYSIHSFMYA